MNDSPSPSGVTAVSIAQMDELLTVADKMLQHVFSDRKRSLGEAAKLVGKLLHAENTSVFLTTDDGKELELAASVNQLFNSAKSPAKTRWKIRSAPGEGFTSNLAALQKAVILSRQQLEDCDFGSSQPLDHLWDGVRYSLLAVPLFHRKQLPGGTPILLGILKCENKLTDAGACDRNLEFSEWDLARAARVAQKIVAVVENLGVFEALAGVLGDVQEKRGRDEKDKSVLVLKAIIQRVNRLVRATRGHFAWKDARQRDLVFAARSGEATPDELLPDQIVPAPDKSFVRAVFEERGVDFRKMDDLRKERDMHPYHAGDPNTLSELAVRVDFAAPGGDSDNQSGTPIGVINVESVYPNWFDDRDIEVLRLVARHSALAIQLVRAEALIRRAFERKEPPSVILTAILDTVIEICGFDEGIVYRCGAMAGEDNLALIATATRHSGPITPDEAMSFNYPLDSNKSFAAWVFANRAAWVSPGDPRVNKKGLSQWNIDRRMFGSPLKVEDETVGVFVLWTRDRDHPADGKLEVPRLDPFARLAAAVIGLDKAESDLRESERKYRSLVNGFPIRFLVKRAIPWDRPKPPEIEADPDLCDGPMLVFDYANDDLLKSFRPQKSLDQFLHDTSNGTIRPTTDWTWFPEQALEYYRTDISVLKTGQSVSRKEVHRAGVDSELQHVRVWKVPVIDQHKRITGVRCVFWSRTDEQREEDLKELLLHELPHRLRRCLRHVGAFLDLESRRSDNPAVKHVLRDSQLRIQTMETVQNILGRDPMLPEVQMDEYLQELVPKVISSFAGEGSPPVGLELQVAESVSFPHHLAFQTGLIVTELVSNSINHAFPARQKADGTLDLMPDCHVIVTLEETSQDVFKLQVMDNGVGLRKKRDETTDNLGSRMVTTLVKEQWGGDLRYFPLDSLTGKEPSERPGTSCRVTFRRKPLFVGRSFEQKPSTQPLPKILIVEDDVVPDGMQCEWLLRSYAYEVLPIVTTRDEAIEAAAKWKPDAIVMDIELRGEPDGGIAAAKAIRETSNVPIVFLTGREKTKVGERTAYIPHSGIVMKGTNIEDNLLVQIYQLFAKTRTGNKVFICYSHKDRDVQASLKETLSMPPVTKLGPDGVSSEIWDDTHLKAGEQWLPAIDAQLRQAMVAILLVSKSFLSSKFIQTKEFPDLLEQANARGTRLLPVGIEMLPEEALEASGLSRFQFVLNTDTKPAWRGDKWRTEVWNAVFQQVARAVNSAGSTG